MPPILYEYAPHRFRHKPPNWISMLSAIFKFTSAPKRWPVYTNFCAVILSRLMILCSKNYFPTSLLDFLHTFSITLVMKFPITNQFIRSTLQFRHFLPTIPLIFLNCFYIFLIFYATRRFLPPPPGTKHTKVPPAENNRRPGRGSEDPTLPKTCRHWRAAPAAPAFPGQSVRGTAGASADG